MRVKRSSVTAVRDPVIAVEIKPLGLADLRFVRDAMYFVAPDWTAELTGICADEATVVVVPDTGDDAAGPSFVISRESFRYRLDRIHWDQMNDLGSYPSLGDVVAAIESCVMSGTTLGEALSVTLH